MGTGALLSLIMATRSGFRGLQDAALVEIARQFYKIQVIG